MNNIPSPYQPEPIVTDEGYGRFSKEEVELLRVFKDERLVLVLKKCFVQEPFTENEKELVLSLFKGNPRLFSAVKNVFIPKSEDARINGGTRWADMKYTEISIAEIKPIVLARKDSIAFIEQGIKRLERVSTDGDDTPLELLIDIGLLGDYEDADPVDLKREVVAFQDSMIYIDQYIGLIKSIASMREESPAERDERLKKNSSK